MRTTKSLPSIAKIIGITILWHCLGGILYNCIDSSLRREWIAVLAYIIVATTTVMFMRHVNTTGVSSGKNTASGNDSSTLRLIGAMVLTVVGMLADFVLIGMVILSLNLINQLPGIPSAGHCTVKNTIMFVVSIGGLLCWSVCLVRLIAVLRRGTTQVS